MCKKTKLVFLCESKSSGAETMFDLLRQDISEAAFLRYQRAQLVYQPAELQPYCIVCDYSTTSLPKAIEEIRSLREAFPNSGIIVYRNTTDLEPESFQLRFTTCYDYLLREMVQRGKNMRELVDHAFRLIIQS